MSVRILLLKKKKKKKREEKKEERKPHPQTCSLPTGSDSWCWIHANLMGQEVGGWENWVWEETTQRGYSDLHGFCFVEESEKQND